MFCFLFLTPLLLLAGAAATNQSFTSSAEMSIASCPITYFGLQYHKVYVAFDADRFSVCFKGLYAPGQENDCIVVSGGTADRGDLAVMMREIPTGSGVHQLLPTLKHAGKCVNIIPLKDSLESEIEQVELGNFGTQAILAIKTHSGYQNTSVEADTQVDGLTVSKQTFHTADTDRGVIADVSGCRLSGFVYKTNTTVMEPDLCATVTCEASGVATAVSDCGPMERCQGNGSCELNTICTVTGSSVIDFVGRVRSVPDRCGYTLTGPWSIPGLQVLGLFQERLRKDVSFLDRVILQLDAAGVQISLEQGGRVQVNNEDLLLNATAQLVHGVELSRDQRGVSAKISASDHTLSVLFDGDTALIHMTGPGAGAGAAPVSGLCGDSSASVMAEKLREHSPRGCELQFTEAEDATIDCNATAEWCGLLTQTPFSSCHEHVDPEPFTAACTHTLCRYPAVDGLRCQFLEAYVRACSLHSGVSVEGWRAETGCTASEPVCQERLCSAHEFCGETSGGRCLCRAVFASEYRSRSSFGEPTVCEHRAASLTLANCLLEEQSIDYTLLHLNDPSCSATMDQRSHMVTFTFNSSRTCGTVVMANDTQLLYRNTIMRRNVSTLGLINRHGPVHIDFSCHYSQPDTRGLAIRIKDSSVEQQMVSGEWNYTLTMTAFADSDRAHALPLDADVPMNERIWVELGTKGLDAHMVALVTDSCWATNEPSPTGSLRYDLVIDGCPNPSDATVQVQGNGEGTSNAVAFNTFQFSGETGDVFLHCRLELCALQDHTCAPSCGHTERRRRSAQEPGQNAAFITMAWTT